MGLLDQVLGSVLGSRQAGSAAQQGSPSMSPLVKSLLLVLAAKACQHYTSQPRGAPSGQQREPSGGPFGDLAGSLDPRGPSAGRGMPEVGLGAPGGGLAGSLGGLLGGLAGAGGLEALLDQFRRSGYDDQVNSWVGIGQNQPISPNELGDALGPEAIDELEQQTGMPREELLSELSDVLPDAVDQFTPEGRIPTQEEVERWV